MNYLRSLIQDDPRFLVQEQKIRDHKAREAKELPPLYSACSASRAAGGPKWKGGGNELAYDGDQYTCC